MLPWPSRAELLTGSGLPPAGFDRAEDDPAALLSTSGTSGRPKLAVTTHRAHVTQVLNTALYYEAADTAAREAGLSPAPAVALLTFPLFHVAGLINLYASTAAGSTVVLLPRWDAREALRLLARERVTAAALVPTMLRQLVNVAAEDGAELPSLGTLISGGAPLPPDLERAVRGAFGRIATGTGYGLTETTGSATSIGGPEFAEHPDSVGRPFPSVLVRLVHPETGLDVPDGEVGEFLLGGVTVARGYWNRPEETAETFVDGWLHTGDLGVREPDSGRLRLVDRRKDVVLRGGENIYCVEVEACLHEHPDVADVAVFGLPDDMYGEVVAAIIVPEPGRSPSARELREHVLSRLAAYKVPAVLVLDHGTLPRNAVGKLLKRELRARFTKAHPPAAPAAPAGPAPAPAPAPAARP